MPIASDGLDKKRLDGLGNSCHYARHVRSVCIFSNIVRRTSVASASFIGGATYGTVAQLVEQRPYKPSSQEARQIIGRFWVRVPAVLPHSSFMEPLWYT